MLGGWYAGPVSYKVFGFVKERMTIMEDKIDALRRLLDSFSPDDKDRVIEILQLALEIAHSPLRA